MSDNPRPSEAIGAAKPPRSRQLRSIRLQERDLALLASLSAARCLSVVALEWLHWPGWRERYKAYLEQRKSDPSMVYRPSPHVYHRLVPLRSGPAPLVHRLTRTVERAAANYQRLPDSYVLAEAGAELLCARCGYELTSVWYEQPRKRSIKNLEHSVAIGTFYAALRAALEWGGQQLADWRGDHLLAGRDVERGGPNYDRVVVPRLAREQAVLPDATFSLAQERYFIEIDRGTMNLEAWNAKVRAYEVYRHSPKLRARYETDTFTVLIVAPTEVRLRRIAEEVLKITRQATTSYLFLSEERVHPTTLRPSWKAVQSFAWTRRKVVDRLIEQPAELVFATQPLWRNP